jgi:hypothetical protein
MDIRTVPVSLDTQDDTLTVQDALSRWHAHHPGALDEAIRPVPPDTMYAVSEFHGVMPGRFRRPRAPRMAP